VYFVTILKEPREELAMVREPQKYGLFFKISVVLFIGLTGLLSVYNCTKRTD
jgi:hypothetical protein